MINGKKVFLVIATGYFGDTLLTAKLTRDIKKEYPNSMLLFIADAPYVDVAKGLPGVDEVISFDRKKCQNFMPLLKFIMKFPYKNKIDVTFIAQGEKTSRNFLASMLGSKKILKLNDFQISESCTELQNKNPLNRRVACQCANLLLSLTGKETDYADIEYAVPKFAEQKIEKFFKGINFQNDLIAINPQAGDDWKCWDVPEVVKLVKLAMKDGKKVVLTGVLKDGPEYIQALDEEIGAENYLNFVGQTTIPELGALYKRCKAVVSVDTGSMHMACAVGVPTIAIFFREHYHSWSPLNTEKNPYIYAPEGVSGQTVYEKVKKCIGSCFDEAEVSALGAA